MLKLHQTPAQIVHQSGTGMKKRKKRSFLKKIFNPYTHIAISLLLVGVGGAFTIASASTYLDNPILSPSPTPKTIVQEVKPIKI